MPVLRSQITSPSIIFAGIKPKNLFLVIERLQRSRMPGISGEEKEGDRYFMLDSDGRKGDYSSV
jgi:hypothetical protein